MDSKSSTVCQNCLSWIRPQTDRVVDDFGVSHHQGCPLHGASPTLTVPASLHVKSEAVDHPVHYGGADNPYEVIKVLEAWLSPEQMDGFNLGNAVKYIARAGKKGDALEDLRKARWYLDRAIKRKGGNDG